MNAPEGLLLVDKPGGITSHDAVARVRRALGTRKVGHAGTLDPMATGLLLIGVGRATRLLRYLSDLEKVYEGTARLGEETDTLDADGAVVRTRPVDVQRKDLEAAMARCTGDLQQVPPAFSAVKVGGERLYVSARRGAPVGAPPRAVTVHAFDLLGFDGRDVVFRVRCSSGTYVRSLLADVGEALGCGAHLIRLRRTEIGPFRVAGAYQPDAPGPLEPVDAAIGHLPRRVVEDEVAAAVRNGRPIAVFGTDGPHGVFAGDGALLAVYRDHADGARPDLVLPPSPVG